MLTTLQCKVAYNPELKEKVNNGKHSSSNKIIYMYTMCVCSPNV